MTPTRGDRQREEVTEGRRCGVATGAHYKQGMGQKEATVRTGGGRK